MSQCTATDYLLHFSLRNGTDVTICGLPYDAKSVCGFFEHDAAVGPQLCCSPLDNLSSTAVCQFTIGQRIGQFIDALSSIASGIAVLCVLFYSARRQLRKRGFRLFSRHGSALQRDDVADSTLFLTLMLADLIQAVANIPTIKWMMEGFIGGNDPVCVAQGALKQVGIVLTALSSLAIGAQTFHVLVRRRPIVKSHSLWVVALLWIAIAIDVGVPNAVYKNASPPYYGSTGFWCWIDPWYKTEQIITEYLWMWISAIVMLVLYGIMFFVMRRSPEPEEEAIEDQAIAKMMLLYPAVYIFCIVPISITRWLQFSGASIPYQATLFGSSIFALNGFLNVLLFWFTRPELVRGAQSGTGSLQGVVLPTHQHEGNGPVVQVGGHRSSFSVQKHRRDGDAIPGEIKDDGSDEIGRPPPSFGPSRYY